MEQEIIYGQVVAKANHYKAVPDKKNGGRRIVKDHTIKAYERNFCKQCKVYRDRMIDGKFVLHLQVFSISMRFDLDNSIKTILDCLQYCKAITDDKLCVGINATKTIDNLNPRVKFSIEELEPNLF